MALRHKLAVRSLQTHDLQSLAHVLDAAVKNAMDDNIMPSTDPAVRLICQHIAFAGNGDFQLLDYYRECRKYCEELAVDPDEDELDQPPPEIPDVPSYQAS